MKTKLLVLTAIFALPVMNAFAANTTANATQVVTAAIGISKVADLDFGTAVQGDAAKVIAPASGANFTVTGQPSTAYTITLPSSVTMQTAGGGTDKDITVNAFTSSPAAGANGMLSATGNQTLRVGATRAALSSSQVTGSYTTTFTVDVAY